FLDADTLQGEMVCRPVWGETPSAELRLPDELLPPRAASSVAAAAIGPSVPAAVPGRAGPGHDAWYGVYPNGTGVLVDIGEQKGGRRAAVYAIGPGIEEDEPAEWSRREGRIVDDDLVFAEDGKSALRFHRRADGGLKAIWISPDGKTSMAAGMRWIDARDFS